MKGIIPDTSIFVSLRIFEVIISAQVLDTVINNFKQIWKMTSDVQPLIMKIHFMIYLSKESYCIWKLKVYSFLYASTRKDSFKSFFTKI